MYDIGRMLLEAYGKNWSNPVMVLEDMQGHYNTQADYPSACRKRVSKRFYAYMLSVGFYERSRITALGLVTTP